MVQAQAGPQYISKHLPKMVGAFFVYITKVYPTSYEIPDFVKIFRIFEERESLKIHRQYLWLQIRHSREVKIRRFLCEKSKSLSFFSETCEKAGQNPYFLCVEKDGKVKAP